MIEQQINIQIYQNLTINPGRMETPKALSWYPSVHLILFKKSYVRNKKSIYNLIWDWIVTTEYSY
jgi:hypothetical protein